MTPEKGYLLLADMTGYTRFIAAAPTEAGGDIAARLLEALLERVEAPFRVANIEGDALFLYAPDDGTASGQTVLDAIDSLYCAFAERVGAMRYGATCPEDPALLAGALDLKLVVHHGEFAVSSIAGRQELSGRDVILLHRLAKNTVTRETGLSGYAMLSKPAVDSMELSRFFESFETRREEVEHFGPIDTYVYPLQPVWERRRRSLQCFVERNAPLLTEVITIDLPVPPCRAWELCTEPQYRMRWIGGVKNISLDNTEEERVGRGSVHYCDHGGGLVVPLTVSDWHPFDYITFDIATPLGLEVRQTIELMPIGLGTRIAIRIARPEVHGLLARWRARDKVSKLRGLFAELYAEAEPTLAHLARGDGAGETAIVGARPH